MEKKRETSNSRTKKIIITEQRQYIKKQLPRASELIQKLNQEEPLLQKIPATSEFLTENNKDQPETEMLEKELETLKSQQKESFEIIQMQRKIIKQLQQQNSMIKKKLKDQKMVNLQFQSRMQESSQDPDLQLAIQLSAAEYNQQPNQAMEIYNPFPRHQHHSSYNNYQHNNEQQYPFQVPMELQREENKEMQQQMRRQLIQEHPELFNPDELTYEELLLLEEKMGSVTNGLSQNQIDKMQKVKISAIMASSNICQCEFIQGEIAKQLRCKHYYHNDCISKWLQSKNNCPVCLKQAL